MDIEEFYEADERRRRSEEIELGTEWHDRDGVRYEVSWVADTGELYVMREPAPGMSEDLFGDEFSGSLPVDAVTVAVVGWIPDPRPHGGGPRRVAGRHGRRREPVVVGGRASATEAVPKAPPAAERRDAGMEPTPRAVALRPRRGVRRPPDRRHRAVAVERAAARPAATPRRRQGHPVRVGVRAHRHQLGQAARVGHGGPAECRRPSSSASLYQAPDAVEETEAGPGGRPCRSS